MHRPVLVLLLLFGLLAQGAAAAPLTVRIGHVGPLTGPIAHLGRDNEHGVRLALEQANARQPQIGGQAVRFELVAEDDAADPRRGLAAAQRLLAAGVVGVVGHLNSGTSIPAASLYAQAGIPALSPSASNPKLTRMGWATAFRLVPDDESSNRVLGQYLGAQQRGQRLAVVDDGSAYGWGSAEAFRSGWRHAGAEDGLRLSLPGRTRVLEQVLAQQPQLLYFGGMDIEAGRLLAELDAAGWRGQFVGPDGICTAGLPEMARGATRRIRVVCAEPGGLPPDLTTSALARFRAEFQQRFGVAPIVYAPQAFDAARLLIDAMLRADSSDPKVFLPLLAATQNFEGVSGRIGFDAKGDLLAPSVPLYTYVEGRREFLGLIE